MSNDDKSLSKEEIFKEMEKDPLIDLGINILKEENPCRDIIICIDHNHDWKFQPILSSPLKNGVRRYKCLRCGIWGHREGDRVYGQPEAIEYPNIYEPLNEWKSIDYGKFTVNSQNILHSEDE